MATTTSAASGIGRAQSNPLTFREAYRIARRDNHASRQDQKAAFGVAGRFPIIDQSQDAIAGWTDDEESFGSSTVKPLVIFGDHTCAIKLVETAFAQGADGIKICKR